MFKNIFNQPVTESYREVTYELTDFCFENTMVDIHYVLEDLYFDVNRNQMIAAHTGLKSDNMNILEEGFKDFVDGAVEFFKKLIKKFSEFMKNVFMYLNAFIGDFEKFIKRYSTELSKKQPNFTIEGYKFTNDSSIPNMSVIEEMLGSYNSEISTVQDMSKSDVVKLRGEAMSDSNMNKIRAKVLNSSESISKDDFNVECKKVFRNGETTADTVQVDQELLNEIVNNYSNMVKSYKTAKKEKEKLIALLENIKTFFQKSSSLHYIEGKETISSSRVTVNANKNGLTKTDGVKSDYKADTMIVYNSYFNFKFAYAKQVSALCVNAMSERVTALKEELHQSKKIVRRSLGASEKISEGGE